MTPAFQHAMLPFELCEQWQLRVGYERSFKMRPGQILANRYLLGITTDQLSIDRARELASILGFPAGLDSMFWDLYHHANLILIGFEDSEPGSIYKLYLEFDQHRLQFAGDESRLLLHRGVKWNPDRQETVHPETVRLTDYVWQPLLPADEIERRVVDVLQSTSVGDIFRSMLQRLFPSCDAREFRYLQIHESGGSQSRQSFDLNVYAADTNVSAIVNELQQISHQFNIPTDTFDNLYSIVRDRPLGHLAAGREGSGAEFCTVYFEAG